MALMVGPRVSIEKEKGEEVPAFPAASLWEAVIALPLPWPREAMLVSVRV